MERSATAANILLVDDDENALDFLNALLSQQGYRVRLTNNGTFALEVARTMSPDLILLDILMPEMNGYEVCAALKADEQLRDIPVLFLSALGTVEDTVKAFECGGVDYVHKPIQKAELLARVKTHLLLRDRQQRLEDQNTRLKQEIVERKRVEKALQESEERLRALIENSEDLIFMQDLEGHYLYYNGPSRYGITSKELLRKTPFDLFPYETASCMVDRIKQVAATGTSLLSENSVTWQNEILWFSDLASPVRDEKGTIVAVSTISRNITNRKQAENALQESEKKYRTLFETMVQGVFYQRADGALVDVNPAALEMFGLTRDQFLTRTSRHPDWRAIHEDGSDYSREQHPSMLALKTGRPVRDAVAGVYNPQKNDYVWLNINAIPQFKPGEDRPYQVFATLYDITETKHLSDQLNIALREKELLLQEMHHRVKNNMQTMTSLCRLHAGKLSDDRVIAIFRELENKIESIALVHEMLHQSENLTRIEMPAYIEDLIYRVFRSFEISSRKIMPRLDVAPVRFGLTTAMPCGLLINELVTNSFKYAFPDDRSGELYVSLQRRDDADSPFELIISDNGIGLPKNFDLDQTDSLGLSLVQGWVKQLHGTMHIDCTQGTRFHIRFQEI